jgi:RNAse (barnase) inhibitor barstar
MKLVDLDTRRWETIDDFYDALLKAIGAPDWHGRNGNALADSMVCGGINSLEPPYVVRILHANSLPEAVRAHIVAVADVIQMVRIDVCRRTGNEVEVSLILDRGLN